MTARRLRLILLFTFSASFAYSNEVVVPPPCSSQSTLEDLEQLGGLGCTSGDFTFKNFSFGSLGGNVDPISASNVAVSFPNASDSLGFLFRSDGFSVGEGQSITYFLTYLVDPPPVIIRGFEEDLLTETPKFPGFASITTSLCAGSQFIQNVDGQFCEGEFAGLSIFHTGNEDTSNRHDSTFFESPTNIVDVQLQILLDGGPANGGGSSSILGASTGTLINAVPEPSTLPLIGGGLALLGLLRRRARKS